MHLLPSIFVREKWRQGERVTDSWFVLVNLRFVPLLFILRPPSLGYTTLTSLNVFEKNLFEVLASHASEVFESGEKR